MFSARVVLGAKKILAQLGAKRYAGQCDAMEPATPVNKIILIGNAYKVNHRNF